MIVLKSIFWIALFINVTAAQFQRPLQWEQFAQKLLADAPAQILNDQHSLAEYLSNRFQTEFKYEDVNQPFSPGGSQVFEQELDSLIEKYQSSKSLNDLEEIGILSLVCPQHRIAPEICDAIKSQQVLNSESALKSLISRYQSSHNRILLLPISRLRPNFPGASIPQDILAELDGRGYNTGVVPPNYGQYPSGTPQLPDSSPETLLTQLINQALTSISLPALKQISELAPRCPNIAVPTSIREQILLQNLMEGLGSAPNPNLFQQIGSLLRRNPDFPVPGSIVVTILDRVGGQFSKAVGDNNLQQTSPLGPSSPYLPSGPNPNAPSPLGPSYPYSPSGPNQPSPSDLIPSLRPSLPIQNRIDDLIEVYSITESKDIFSEIEKMVLASPNVRVPTFIANTLTQRTDNDLITTALDLAVEKYTTSPSADVLAHISQLSGRVPHKPLPASIAGILADSFIPLSSVEQLSNDEIVLEQLIQEYNRHESQTILSEIADLVNRSPHINIPPYIRQCLNKRDAYLNSAEYQMHNLINEYYSTNSETTLKSIAELASKYPNIPLPNSIEILLQSQSSITIVTSQVTIHQLEQLIYQYYDSPSSQLLTEIFNLASHFPGYQLPEILVFQHLVEVYLLTKSSSALQRIGLLFFDFPSISVSESIIEDLIAQSFLPSTIDRYPILLRYLITNYANTNSYSILSTIALLYSKCPDITLPDNIIQQLIRLGLWNNQSSILTLTTIQEKIHIYINSPTPALLLEIRELSKKCPEYPFPVVIQVDNLIQVYTSPRSQSDLVQIGRLLYRCWNRVIPESILIELLEKSLILGTEESEQELFIYIITNYASTKSDIILETIKNLHLRYPNVKLPQNILDLFYQLGVIENPAVVKEITSLFDELSDLSTAGIINAGSPLARIIPVRELTQEKLALINQRRVDEVKILVNELITSSNRTDFVSYRNLQSLLRRIVKNIDYYSTEASARVAANQGIVEEATLVQLNSLTSELQEFDENSRIVLNLLGKSAGAIEGLVGYINSGSLNMADLSQLIQQVLLLDKPIQSIEGIFDNLSAFLVLEESVRQSALELILPSRQETVDELLITNQQRVRELAVLIEATVQQLLTSGVSSEKKVATVLNRCLEFTSSLVSEAKTLSTENRQLISIFSNNDFIVSESDLQKYVENSKTIEYHLGKAAGAIEALVTAISSGDVTVTSIGQIFNDILKLGESISAIDFIYDEVASVASVRGSIRPTTLAAILPWRQATVEKHIGFNKDRLKAFTVLVNDLISHSKLSSAINVYSAILNLVTALTKEAERRAIANKNILDSIAKSNYDVSAKQLEPYVENVRVLASALGRAAGATDAFVVAYINGDLSEATLRGILEIVLGAGNELSPIEILYDDLNTLVSVGIAFAPQQIKAASQPYQHAVLQRHLITRKRRLEELTILLEGTIAQTPHPAIKELLRNLLQIIAVNLAEAEDLQNVDRKYLEKFQKNNWVIDEADWRQYKANIKAISKRFAIVSGTTEAVVNAYNSGKLTVRLTTAIIQKLQQFSQQSTLAVDTLFEDSGPLVDTDNNGAIVVRDSTRQEILAYILTYRQTVLEATVRSYTRRLDEFVTLIEDIITKPTDESIVELLESILAYVVALFNEGNSRISSSANILNWLQSRNFVVSDEQLSTLFENHDVAFSSFGRVEGTIEAVSTAYKSGNLNLPALLVIVERLESYINEGIVPIEYLYDELAQLITVSAGTNLRESLKHVLTIILGDGAYPGSFTGRIDDAINLRNLIKTAIDIQSPINSVDDVVALQTILAVILPSRQTSFEALILITKKRLEEVTLLAEDIKRRAIINAEPQVVVVLKEILSVIRSNINEAQIRVNDNKRFILTAAQKLFLISPPEFEQFLKNARETQKLLGAAEGALKALANAYESGQFDIIDLVNILKNIYRIGLIEASVDNVYFDIGDLARRDVSNPHVRQHLIASSLPYRQVTLEKHIEIKKRRLQDLTVLLEDTISKTPHLQKKKLLTSILKVVAVNIAEAESRFLTNRNIIESIKKNDWQASDETLTTFTKNVEVAGKRLGEAAGAITSVVIAYNSGKLTVELLDFTLTTLVTVTEIETLYDNIGSLITLPIGSGLQTTLLSVLNHLGVNPGTGNTIGTVHDALALHKLWETLTGNNPVSLTSGLSSTEITSVNDVVALQAILAILLPSKQANLERLVITIERRLQEATSMVEVVVDGLQHSDLPSNKAIVSLLRGIIQIIGYFTAEGEIRSNAAREIILTATKQQFLISTALLQPFIENVEIASNSLGRASGATEALINAINSGKLNVGTLDEIIRVLLQIDSKVGFIDSIFDDLQPILKQDGILRRDLLEIILPTLQENLEKKSISYEQRVEDLQILIDDIIERSTDSGLKPYQGIVALLDSILTIVLSLFKQATTITRTNRNIITTLASRSFEVSSTELTSFTSNIEKAMNVFGRIEGTIQAVVSAYQSGQFSSGSLVEIITNQLQLTKSISSIETSFTTLESLIGIDDVSRPTILSIMLPPWTATLEKHVVLNQNRLRDLTILLTDTIDKTHSPTIKDLLSGILNLVTSLSNESNARFVANKNLLSWIASRDYAVSSNDLKSFIDNVRVASIDLGKIEGLTVAVVNAYVAGDFNVNNLQITIELIDKITKTESTIESAYQDLDIVNTFNVGSNLQTTLANVLGKPISSLTGTIEEANLLHNLLTTISNSLNSVQPIQSINDVVALQTILAVILPTRQTVLDKLIIIQQRRLQQLTVLVTDVITRASESGSQTLLRFLNQTLGLIRQAIKEAQIRADENRQFISSATKRNYLISATELRPFIANSQVALKSLGIAAGATDALAVAYNDGKLSIATFSKIIIDSFRIDQTILSIESLYDEIRSIIILDANIRPQILAKSLPWLQGTLEKHITVNQQRILDLTVLVEDIIEHSVEPITSLVVSILSLVESLTEEATSRVVANKNIISWIRSQKFDVSDEQLTSLVENVQVAGHCLGRAAGVTEAIVLAYNSGKLTIPELFVIIDQIVNFQQIAAPIDSIYDDLQVLNTFTIGSNLQKTLETLLTRLGPITGNTISIHDAKNFYSLINSVSGYLKNAGLDSGQITSVNDVIALQTILAIVLPARQAVLDKFVLVTLKRQEETNILLHSFIQKIDHSDLPSHKSIVALLNGVGSIIGYFTKEASIRATANRNIVLAAANQRFIISPDQLGPYIKNGQTAFNALGRASGAIDAVVAIINTGKLDIADLNGLIRIILQISDKVQSIESIFDDLQPILSLNGVVRQNILEITLPVWQEALETDIVRYQQRLVEFEGLIENIVEQYSDSGVRQYQSIRSLLVAILSFVKSYVEKSYVIVSANSEAVSSAAGNNFVVSTGELNVFIENSRNVHHYLGHVEGAIEAVIKSYNEGNLSSTILSTIITELFQFQQSTTSLDSIYGALEGIIGISDSSRRSILSVILKYRLVNLEKNYIVNRKRLEDLKILANDIIDKSSNTATIDLVSYIIRYIESLTNEARSRNLANQNIFEAIKKQNFVASENDLESFNYNDEIAFGAFGRVAGATDALVIAYASGEFTVTRLVAIIQDTLKVDTNVASIESVYQDLDVLNVFEVGSDLLTSLKSALAADKSISSALGNVNDEATLRALIGRITDKSISETVALQTILAVILPTRQVVLDKLVLINRRRVNDLQILLSDVLQRASNSYSQTLVNGLNSIFSLITHLSKEALVRADQNREFINQASNNLYLLSLAELKPFISNSQVALKYLGAAEGATEAVIVAYNNGDLNTVLLTNIYNQYVKLQNSAQSIESLYDELLVIIGTDGSTRQRILANILPNALATSEKHIIVNNDRVRDLTVLLESILTSTEQVRIQQLLQATLNLVNSLSNEANSRVLANKNIFSIVKSKNFEVSNQQLRIIAENYHVASHAMGQAAGVTDAIVWAYNEGKFSVSRINVIIQQFISSVAILAPIEQIFDETTELSSHVFSSNFQSTLTSLLTGLGYSNNDVTSFGTLDDVSALLKIVGNLNIALQSGASSSTSLNDAIVLQTILAIILPARQTFEANLLLSNQKLISEVSALAQDYIIQLSGTKNVSKQQIILLVNKIISLAKLLNNDAEAGVVTSSELIQTALARKFLITITEVQTFSETSKQVAISLGKSTGVLEALKLAINSNNVNISSLTQLLNLILNTEAAQQFYSDFESILGIAIVLDQVTTIYHESHSFSSLKEVSVIHSKYPDLVIPDDILTEINRLGLNSAQVSDETLLLQLFEQYQEVQSSDLLEQTIALLQRYPNTNIPRPIMVVLLERGIIIQSSSYLQQVVAVYNSYSSSNIRVISELLSLFPKTSLPLRILEDIVEEQRATIVVLDQLVQIYLGTRSYEALVCILKIYSSFPDYTLPAPIIDIINQKNSPSLTTISTTSVSSSTSSSTSTSPIQGNPNTERQLQLLIQQYLQSPTESILFEIEELYRIVPSVLLPGQLSDEITLVRLVNEVIRSPVPSLSKLRDVRSLSEKYRIVTIPTTIVEQISLLTWTELSTPTVEILMAIAAKYNLYPHIPIPNSIQEQILLVQLLRSDSYSVQTLKTISTLTKIYSHIPISKSISEQLIIVELIQSQTPSPADLNKIFSLSQIYPSIPLPIEIEEQIVLVQLIQSKTLTQSILEQIVYLSPTYPHIPLPQNIEQILVLQQLIEEVVYSSSPSIITIRQIATLSLSYPEFPIPDAIRELISFHQLIDKLLNARPALPDDLERITHFIKRFPGVRIPDYIRQLLSSSGPTFISTSTTSTSTTTSSTSSSSSTVAESSVPSVGNNYAPILPSGVTPESRLKQLIQQLLASPSITVLREIVFYAPKIPNVNIPLVVREQIRLIELLDEVSVKFSDDVLEEISQLSQAFPYVPIPTYINQQIKLVLLIQEALRNPPSYVIIKEIVELSERFPLISIPQQIEEHMELVVLIREVLVTKYPAPSILQRIQELSLKYPSVQIPAPIKEQINLIQLIQVTSKTSSPDLSLLREIAILSRTYQHVPIQSQIKREIRLIQLIDEVVNSRSASVSIIVEISQLSSLLPSIPLPKQVQEQVTLCLLIKQVTSSFVPSFDSIKIIAQLSPIYQNIHIPAAVSEQITLLSLITEVSESSTPSLDSLLQIAKISSIYPHLPIPEIISKQISLQQLIIEANSGPIPSLVILEQISVLITTFPNFPCPNSIKEQILLYQLVQQVSLSSSPDISIVRQIFVLSIAHPHIPIPRSLASAISLLQLLETVSQSPETLTNLLPRIRELAPFSPYIPIPAPIQQQITLLDLCDEVVATPFQSPDNVNKISQLLSSNPSYKISSTCQKRLNEVSSSSQTISTSAIQIDQLVSYVSENKFPSPVVLRQLAQNPVQQNLDSSIQDQITLLQLIEETQNTPVPSIPQLQQIATLAYRYPNVPVPELLLDQITLIQLVEQSNQGVHSRDSLLNIARLSSLYPNIPISYLTKQRIELVQLADSVVRSEEITLSVIQQLSQLCGAYPDVAVPAIVGELIELNDLIVVLLQSPLPSIEIVQRIIVLSELHTNVKLPRPVLEVTRLLSLLDQVSKSTVTQVALLKEIAYISLSCPNIPISDNIQQQIYLLNLIEEVEQSSEASLAIILEIRNVAPLVPGIPLPTNILQQIELIDLIQLGVQQQSLSPQQIQRIVQLSSSFPNIKIPQIINQLIAVQKIIGLGEVDSLSEEAITEISEAIHAFPTIQIPDIIRQQIEVHDLIQEVAVTLDSSPAVIEQLVNGINRFPRLFVPQPVQDIINLNSLIQTVATSPASASLGDLQQINQLIASYPNVAIPIPVHQQVDILPLIEEVLQAPHPLPAVLQKISDIESSYPYIPLPDKVKNEIEMLGREDDLHQLIDQWQLSPSPDLIQQIEKLAQFFPDVPLPDQIQTEVIEQMQKTVLKQLIEEAQVAPSPAILQQIEQLAPLFPGLSIPENVQHLIETQQLTTLLDDLVLEVETAEVPSTSTLHQIFELSHLLPDYQLPPEVEQTVVLQQLIERVLSSSSPSIEDLLMIQQISEEITNVPIPPHIQQQIVLADLIAQAQEDIAPSRETLLQISEISEAYPNIPIPEDLLQKIAIQKETIVLEQLVQQILSSPATAPSIIQQIIHLSEKLSITDLPQPVLDQIKLTKLIQSVSPTSTPDSATISQIAQLSDKYPAITVPYFVKKLILKAKTPAKNGRWSSGKSTSKTLKSTISASENQLRQYVSMYQRIGSPLILKQIAGLLPSVPNYHLPLSVINALVKQGLIPASAFPEMRLQELIVEYESTHSEVLIKQIADLSSSIEGVTLPASLNQAVQLQKALSIYNELTSLNFNSLPAIRSADGQVARLRIASLDKQVVLSRSYLSQARNVIQQLSEHVRSFGHPMHHATVDAFQSVLKFVESSIESANVAINSIRSLSSSSGGLSAQQLSALNQAVRDVQVLLGRSEGARQALIKEAKEFSIQVMESHERIILQSQKTKVQLEEVLNKLMSQTNLSVNI